MKCFPLFVDTALFFGVPLLLFLHDGIARRRHLHTNNGTDSNRLKSPLTPDVKRFDSMEGYVARWWTLLSETDRHAALAEHGILPGNHLGRECFSYGLVNRNLPEFAQRVVEQQYRRQVYETTHSTSPDLPQEVS